VEEEGKIYELCKKSVNSFVGDEVRREEVRE
jgi:hypothetical protein